MNIMNISLKEQHREINKILKSQNMILISSCGTTL